METMHYLKLRATRQHTLYSFHLWEKPPIVIPQHAARPINFILSMFLIRPLLRL